MTTESNEKVIVTSDIYRDGNIFAVLGFAHRAMRRAGKRTEADEMQARALASSSYDEALSIIFSYVEVQDDDEDGDFESEDE